jgi:tRNA nucleotidyltransferase (CCA-adding enzyme)
METKHILKEVLEKVRPSKEEIDYIERLLKEFTQKIEKEKEKLGIKVEVFIGGSYAKKTLIKKDRYDIDIFLRFDKKYSDKDLSKLTKKLLKNNKKIKLIHGSRDYFQYDISPSLFFEIVPVLKINKTKDAQNITDLSYSHVKYINKKIKSKKILEEIMIAKAFCNSTNCYGAESYINGFSGYSIELLVYYYGGFFKFLKEISKIKKKEIIDIERLHKKKQNILLDLNSSKLQAPIILIDPTYKQRNALAALSEDTFKKFQEDCNKFLKKPTIDLFRGKKIDEDSLKQKAKEKKLEFVLVNIETDRQKGDIAGSKLFKFYKHLVKEIEKYFEIKENYFEYLKNKEGKFILLTKSKKDILIKGPFSKDKINNKLFKKKHKNTFVKKGRIYAREKINFTTKEFVKKWKNQNDKKIKDMGITNLKVI